MAPRLSATLYIAILVGFGIVAKEECVGIVSSS